MSTDLFSTLFPSAVWLRPAPAIWRLKREKKKEYLEKERKKEVRGERQLERRREGN